MNGRSECVKVSPVLGLWHGMKILPFGASWLRGKFKTQFTCMKVKAMLLDVSAVAGGKAETIRC